MPDPHAGDDLAYAEAWENRLGNCEECGTHGVDTDYKGADGRSVCDDCREDMCDKCGASTDDGEGYDGLCGNCADRAEAAGRWS